MQDGGFEILSQAADIRMRVWGKTPQELFRAALRGAASYLMPGVLDSAEKEMKIKQEIKIEAVDIHSLLIAFLSEVIAQTDALNAVFGHVSFKEFGEDFLLGELCGIKAESPERGIKAVSYHEVDIKKNPETGFYETILVFDI